MSAAVVMFTRDLRIHDNPALDEARCRAEHVVPLFVLDEAILRLEDTAPNRVQFLLDALADLRRSLRELGADLILRRGDPVDEAVTIARQVGARTVYLARDVTPFARDRERRLSIACAESRMGFQLTAGSTVVEPGAVTPTSGDHYKVFTPYSKVWESTGWRPTAPTPDSLSLPPDVGDPGSMPDRDELVQGHVSPDLIDGGETSARKLMNSWTRSSLADYDDGHDDLAGDRTSHLGAHLHLGTMSALEVATRLNDREGGGPYVRQLCWRDFHHQVTAAFPDIATAEYRGHDDDWNQGGEDFDAWAEGRTGYPIVDAGMRQLRREGWMHNRARMITASFLTKDLYQDWRAGGDHFMRWLVDGDVANNYGNWQWIAGTGNDTRPNRVFNPLRQAERFDPDGTYVRRYVEELADIEGGAVHEPWKLDGDIRKGLDYPDPVVDHDQAAKEFKARRE